MDLSTPCVLWVGSISAKGYGRLKVRGRLLFAHRYVYEQQVGPIPSNYVLDHACHNADLQCPGGTGCLHRRCVNPDHLDAITTTENNLRGRVNVNKTHCKRGHVFDAANTYVHERGSRDCRTCNAERARARYSVQRSR